MAILLKILAMLLDFDKKLLIALKAASFPRRFRRSSRLQFLAAMHFSMISELLDDVLKMEFLVEITIAMMPVCLAYAKFSFNFFTMLSCYVCGSHNPILWPALN